MGILELVSTLLGALVGGGGSALSKWLSMKEKQQSFDHEIRLLEMQMRTKQSETENELAIAHEETFASMREASYVHDASSADTSRWVNNTLRMVRPVLTLLLIALVWCIWLTVAQDDMTLQHQIVEGVLFMASAALAWWFGDRSPQSKKLPWQ